jgi:nitrite reductase (NO-forming)
LTVLNACCDKCETDFYNGGMRMEIVVMHAKVGKPLTIAFVNAGPNQFSAFHIVGSLIHDAQASGNPNNHLYDVHTYTVAPGDGALFTVVFHKAGTYTYLSHVMTEMEKGAVAKITVSP